MREMRRMLGVLVCVLWIAVMSVPARAEEYPDTYTIRIYAGRQGVMTECAGGSGSIAEDGKVFLLSGLRYGSRINIGFAEIDGRFVMSVQDGEGNRSQVTFDVESKYYIMGTRESGKDNSERIGSMLIEGDRDYVAAYGMMKDSVEYTVHYVDSEGKALRESEKYRGTIGDKPVIAYQYLEGYQPQAYNLTKTLSANAAENVFTFIYSKVTTPVNVVTVPGEPGVTAAPPAGGAVVVIPGDEVAGPGGGDAGVPGGDEDTGNPGGDEEIPDDPLPQGGPEETIDLDDENVPQHGYEGGDGPLSSIIGILNGNAVLLNVSPYVRVLLLCGMAVLLGGGIWWMAGCLLKKRRREGVRERQEDDT
ncbi:MAG: MucBP domain-containing protein [Lachnospiraceae bacterium]|jgi:hypothetical protein|nr:MucBP domain-containing protein [Lachnospiraceae bacterium]